MPVRGRFITLEGGEGAGKSTQIRLLAEALRERGIEVLTTREPGGSPGAEAIRDLLVNGEPGRWQPLTEAMLVNAARHEHLTRTVLPSLSAGTWVVCDRFADSTLAYQGYGLGVHRDALVALHRLAVAETMPDLTLILDIDPEAGIARTASRRGGEDRYERMGTEFHRRLRQGFLDIAAGEPDRCAVIDAAQPVETVQAAILAEVGRRLGGVP
ncbi:dTMP kinase [Indioceanicola profundi]|uniref:dTMP kinase n=1 Tax=Indioceanicola profundi TaxID=2220096 RepID=UPI000E6ACCD5|nr:dTMP kinase [Indioceanicola profundi]